VGAPTRAAGLHLSRATLGEYQPQAASSQWSAAGDLTLVGTRRSLVAQARLFSMEANHPTPLLAAARTGATTTPPTRFTPSRAVFPWGEPADSARRDRLGNAMLPPTSIPSGPQNDAASTAPQSVHQYTIGAVATAVTTDGWTSRLTVGLDGYRLTNPIADPGLLGSAADSALRAASGAADRLTLRASTTRSTSIATAGTASLTLTADHSTLREATTSATVGAPAPTTPPADAILRHSTGAIARADLAWRATRLTAGARLEQNRGFSTLPQLSLLPTLAASHTRQVGPVTATARAAWGEAIRPPRLAAMRLGSTQAMRLMIDAALAPERQAGTELGLDLTWGPHLAVGLTRFDQRATGLLQAATVTAELAPWRSTSARRLMTAVQNVGEITNHGWEATATARRGALTLTGALGTVQSTVSQVSPGYLGDLRAGDRMLDVPRYTAGLTASWTAARWSASIGGARAGQWIGYDRAAMAADLASGRRTPEQIAGGALRVYWREYDAISRLRAAFTRELGRRLTLTLTGDNLLDVRRGEPDNLTVLPGRTIAAGLRARL
jgi:iron complex outermembrane receptor protein